MDNTLNPQMKVAMLREDQRYYRLMTLLGIPGFIVSGMVVLALSGGADVGPFVASKLVTIFQFCMAGCLAMLPIGVLLGLKNFEKIKELEATLNAPVGDVEQGGGAAAPMHDTVVSGPDGSAVRVTY